jgi:dUTP pyrophosphatase
MREFLRVSRVSNIDFEMPRRSTKNSGGYDFYAIEDIEVPAKEIVYAPTGIKVQMPENEVLILANRSSNPKKKGIILASGINIIDADYYNNEDNEGEIALILQNITDNTVVIKKGEKTVQGMFIEYRKTDSDNAEGIRKSGIGSTGV